MWIPRFWSMTSLVSHMLDSSLSPPSFGRSAELLMMTDDLLALVPSRAVLATSLSLSSSSLLYRPRRSEGSSTETAARTVDCFGRGLLSWETEAFFCLPPQIYIYWRSMQFQHIYRIEQIHWSSWWSGNATRFTKLFYGIHDLLLYDTPLHPFIKYWRIHAKWIRNETPFISIGGFDSYLT